MAPTTIKLLYFDARGRAEVSRLVLAAVGQQFEDIRLPREKWATEKANTPFGQLPVLEIDGRRYAQSLAIATYLAREFGLYGTTNEDGLAVDQVIQLSIDLSSSIARTHRKRDETKKAELVKKTQEVDVPKFLEFFEKLLHQNGSGYFVGATLTLADIIVYDQLDSLIKRGFVNTEMYPSIQAFIRNVEGNENIKSYLKTRTESDH
ncbi:glutathione S-transferase 4-like [Biomphalaria glabrata]|uniref:Glutathione S-transferase 4-like n=1 Tax=Biomphalaria glabrata TaxID=6526 RepID=A0A9U8ELW8_BIOGL|nr:glutathione S-transferase 4-like [Biomphalaria glabrata]